MYTYSLLANSSSILRSDGACIPTDPGNTDYAAYLAWLAAGNTVAPVAPPSSAQLWAVYQAQAKAALDNSDTTMHRVSEAIALGLNTAAGADVVAFVNYRRALRAIVSTQNGTPGMLPTKPAYPAGT
jgi:hypothetical protein